MKAEEARRITKQAREIDLKPIMAKIERAARDGDSHVTISLENSSLTKFVDEAMAALRNEGYEVKHDHYSDFRDSWNNLVISW